MCGWPGQVERSPTLTRLIGCLNGKNVASNWQRAKKRRGIQEGYLSSIWLVVRRRDLIAGLGKGNRGRDVIELNNLLTESPTGGFFHATFWLLNTYEQ